MSIMLQEITPQSIIQAYEDNIIAFWSLFAAHPRVHLYNENGIFWFETGIHHDIFNHVIYTDLSQSSDYTELDRVIASFQQRGLPFVWHLGPGSRPAHLDELLEARGLKHYSTEPVMAIDLSNVNYDEALTMVAGLVIKPVTTIQELEQWWHIWEYGSPLDVIETWIAFSSHFLDIPNNSLKLYLGLLNGKPVANCGIFCAEGVAGIEHVATLPDYRRQGVGTAMTRYALQTAYEKGYRVGVLTASSMGQSVYKQLGFHEYAAQKVYLWHPHSNHS